MKKHLLPKLSNVSVIHQLSQIKYEVRRKVCWFYINWWCFLWHNKLLFIQWITKKCDFIEIVKKCRSFISSIFLRCWPHVLTNQHFSSCDSTSSKPYSCTTVVQNVIYYYLVKASPCCQTSSSALLTKFADCGFEKWICFVWTHEWSYFISHQMFIKNVQLCWLLMLIESFHDNIFAKINQLDKAPPSYWTLKKVCVRRWLAHFFSEISLHDCTIILRNFDDACLVWQDVKLSNSTPLYETALPWISDCGSRSRLKLR